jgi:hypothetical protein
MTKFAVEVDSPFEGCKPDAEFTVDTGDPQTADRYGTTAESVAYAVAGDYCDSGTVTVTAPGGLRAFVARHASAMSLIAALVIGFFGGWLVGANVTSAGAAERPVAVVAKRTGNCEKEKATTVIAKHTQALCRRLERRAAALLPEPNCKVGQKQRCIGWSAAWADACTSLTATRSTCKWRITYRDHSLPKSKRWPNTVCSGTALGYGRTKFTVKFSHDEVCA